MTQCGRGEREIAETDRSHREESPGTEGKGPKLGRTGAQGNKTLEGEEKRESKRKQIFKTRHFPNYKIRCRLALRGAGVTLSVWTQDTRQMGGDATKVSGIQSLLALSPAQPESGPGLSLSDKALETLSECVIKG